MCVHPQLPLDICRLLGIAALEDIAYESLDEREPLQYCDTIQVRYQARTLAIKRERAITCCFEILNNQDSPFVCNRGSTGKMCSSC